MEISVETARNHLLPDAKSEFARTLSSALTAAFPQVGNANDRIEALMRELERLCDGACVCGCAG